MKLPFGLGQKKKEVSHLFLSLLLYPDAVEAAVWELEKRTGAHIVSAVTQELVKDGWQERLEAADKCISTLEELAKTTRLEKVVLGLPPSYLTQDGDILKDIRQPLKHVSESLGLVPIGYVSIYQAIIHKLKSEEGVPPSVILLGLSSQVVTLHLYRVGTLVGEETVALQGGLAEHLEDALIRLNDGGILPSRILLYGTKRSELEMVKREVLKHPWTKGNQFLHFPKVEILPGDGAAVAVSYAGSAELAHDMTETLPASQELGEEIQTAPEEKIESVTPVAPVPVHHMASENVQEETEGEDEVLDDVSDEIPPEDELDKEDVVENGEDEEDEDDFDKEDEEEIGTEETEAAVESKQNQKSMIPVEPVVEDTELTPEVTQTHSNVVAVDPTMVGFEDEAEEEEEEYAIEEEERAKHRKSKGVSVAPVMGALSSFTSKFKIKKPTKVETGNHKEKESMFDRDEENPPKPFLKFIPIIGGPLIILAVVLMLFTFILPKATVEVTVTPKMVAKSASVIVDPSLSEVSIDSQKVPGIKKQEQQTGDKTVPATGKKTVGDPAHGTITLFNKSETEKSIHAGTAVVTGSLSFKLDDDVDIASASESLDQGTVTYGKATVKVTAKEIGTSGNIGAGKTFSVTGISSDLVSGRNDSAFSGGTSQDILVVSRADQDSIVKALTQDLSDKVQQAFSSSQGSETLIPDTIKTQVTEKVFSQDVGAQSKDVNGKITVAISGIAYKKEDVQTLLGKFITQDVPEGYRADTTNLTLSVSSPKIAKDGTIKIDASGSAQAVPNIPISQLMSQIAGKSVDEAKTIISKFPGIADIKITVSSSLFAKKLPSQAQKIKIVTKEAQ